MKNVFVLVIALLAAVVPRIMSSGAVLRLAMIAQAVSPPLHVTLAFDAGATPAFEAAVAEEAARVWAPYGIALGESREDSPSQSGTITLHVAMAQRPDRGTKPDALGSIVFTGGRPEPCISLYVATADDLVSAATHSAPSHWPLVYHDAILSRVLGRALAHEIGHYVLNGRTHSESGLMRAAQPVTELMEFRDTNLGLSPAEVAALCRTDVKSLRRETIGSSRTSSSEGIQQ